MKSAGFFISKSNFKGGDKSMNKNFFMVPNDIFKLKLKPRDFTVLACLIKHSNNVYICFPSYRTIAKECSISEKTVGQSLKMLSNKRLIKISNRKRDDGSKSSNLYHIIFLNVKR